MALSEAELTRYSHLNSIAEANGAVFFGGNCFADLPVGELARDFGVDMPVYNRSIPGLSVYEAERALEECVYKLDPARIFVCLGDADMLRPDFDLGKFLAAYEWLLYTLHNHCKGRIYVVSAVAEHPLAAQVNAGAQRIARDAGCTYIDITRAARCERQELRIFDAIRHYLRTHPMNFVEAFTRPAL